MHRFIVLTLSLMALTLSMGCNDPNGFGTNYPSPYPYEDPYSDSSEPSDPYSEPYGDEPYEGGSYESGSYEGGAYEYGEEPVAINDSSRELCQTHRSECIAECEYNYGVDSCEAECNALYTCSI